MSDSRLNVRVSCLVTLMLVAAGCASRDLWPIERVDPETAVHLTIMAEPWMYVLDDPERPENARVYANATVVEANRTGTRSYWLNIVAWDVSARGNDAGEPVTGGPTRVVLAWPTKQIRLDAVAEGRAAAGISEPAIRVPGKRLGESWYPLSAAQVRDFGAGAPTSIVLVDSTGGAQPFAPWQVEDAAMTEFLKATGSGAN